MQRPTASGYLLQKPWLAGAWLILFAACIFLYVFWSAPLTRIASNLTPLLLALFFLLSFTGIGTPVARLFGTGEDKGMEFLASAALGIGITGIFVYFLGLLGYVRIVPMLIWTLCGFLLFAIALVRRFKPALEMPPLQFWSGLSLAILAVFILQEIPFLIAPELTTDGLEFHLLVPKIYLVTGRISHIPGLVESNYPSLAEYNYTLILGLTNEIVCKCFHFWVGMLLLAAIGKLSWKVDPTASKSLAPALFFSMPVVAIVAGWAWNDLFFAFFLVLSLCCLLNFHTTSRTNTLLLCGVLCGFASCTKYTFVMVFAAMLLLFIIGMFFWEWRFKHLVYFVLPIGALSMMWFVKNWVFTGNPFYPFLNRVFGSPYWNVAANQYFLNTLTNYELGAWNWKTNFTFPFLLALKPKIADVHIGVLPLVLAPLAFLRTGLRSMGLLKAFVLCYLAVWLAIRTEVRSLLPMLAVLCVVYSTTLQQVRWRMQPLRSVFTVLVAVSISVNFFITILTTYFIFDPVRYFIGRETRGQYRTRLSKTQEAYDFLNRRDDVGRVLLVSIHNPFYLKAEPIFSSCCDPPVIERLLAGATNADEVRRRLLEMGITHVIINPGDYHNDYAGHLYSWSLQSRKSFEEFLLTRCRKLAVLQGDVVFQIERPS